MPAEDARVQGHLFVAVTGRGLAPRRRGDLRGDRDRGIHEQFLGLVGQRLLGHEPHGEFDGRIDGVGAHGHLVGALEGRRELAEDVARDAGREFGDLDALKPPPEGWILLDPAVVLHLGGGCDDRDFAGRQRRLEVVGYLGRLACARAGREDRVGLVDEEDDILLCFAEQRLDARLELAAVGGAADEAGAVELDDPEVEQGGGHGTFVDALRERGGQRRFAHTRLARQQRVSLLGTEEHVDDALQLLVAPLYLGQPSGGGLCGEVSPDEVECRCVAGGEVVGTVFDRQATQRVGGLPGHHAAIPDGGPQMRFEAKALNEIEAGAAVREEGLEQLRFANRVSAPLREVGGACEHPDEAGRE